MRRLLWQRGNDSWLSRDLFNANLRSTRDDHVDVRRGQLLTRQDVKNIERKLRGLPADDTAAAEQAIAILKEEPDTCVLMHKAAGAFRF